LLTEVTVVNGQNGSIVGHIDGLPGGTRGIAIVKSNTAVGT
jgi:hypothetical protein